MAYTDFYGNSPDDYTPPTGQNNRTTQNPDFVAPAQGNLHLSSGSPAIDMGGSLSTVTADIDGHGRPFGTGFDRGADEYTADAPCYARLDAGQVYTAVQAAVDAATAGDTVKIAGYCAEVSEYSGLTQTVYLNKSLTLRGAYTVTDWTTPQYGPTVLDAQEQGRVIYVTGAVATIENLHLTGGHTAYPGGGLSLGGLVSATVQNNVIYHNTASNGGGIRLDGASRARLRYNTIYSNTATNNGGGVLNQGIMTVLNNIIVENVAVAGGGLAQGVSGELTLDYNDFYANSPDDCSGASPGEHSLAVAPGLEDPADGDFHLNLSSPLINVADPDSTLAYDFEGDHRPTGPRADVGADERDNYAAVILSASDPFVVLNRDDVAGHEVTFTHTFTNTGYTPSMTDTFDVVIANLAGWAVSPDSISGVGLLVNDGHTFQLTVTVPSTVSEGFVNETVITVTSRTNAGALDTATDEIANPGIQLSANAGQDVTPGAEITYTHVVTNVGPPDTFTVTVDSSLGWGELTVPVEPIQLDYQQSALIQVRVAVSETAAANLSDNSLLRVTSHTYPSVSAVVTDTTTAESLSGDRYVEPEGQDDQNNCTQAYLPCKTVGHAVAQAVATDEVLVARGNYLAGAEIRLRQAISVKGGYLIEGEEFVAPEEVEPAATVIDFGGNNRGVQIDIGAGTPIVLEGFTFRNASAPTGAGGGIYVKGDSSPLLRHLIIENCEGARGGGIYVENGAPIIEDMVISGTLAERGGGLYNDAGDVQVDGLIIRYAEATDGPGGGIYNGGSLIIANGLIYSNTTTAGGGGVYNAAGALLSVLNNTLYGNQASTYGGGLYNDGGWSLTISNTLVISNSAATGGGVYHDSSGALSHDYNDIWGNSASVAPESNLALGAHSVSVNPLFQGIQVADFHLTASSPAVDSADPATSLTTDFEEDPRPSNQGFDMGADELLGCLARVINPNPAPDEDPQVGPVYYSIQEAVDAAPRDYIVQVSGICWGVQPRLVDGDWVSQTVVITKSLTLAGGYAPDFAELGPDPEPTIFDALGRGRVMLVHNPYTGTLELNVSHIVFQRGAAPVPNGLGGGIYNQDAELVLDAVEVSASTATKGGGCYNAAGGTLQLGATHFLTNTAQEDGGAIYNLGDMETISITSFISNTAALAGGAVYNAGTLDLERSTLVGNMAATGGGLYNIAALTLVNTIVAQSTATGNGGGLYNEASSLEVRHVTFYANQAQLGGGIYHDDNTTNALINSSLLVSNTAETTNGGGGIYTAQTPDPQFDYNDLYANSGGNYGGELGAGDGIGNLSYAPDFISVLFGSSDFLHLAEGSPVEDKGDPHSPILIDIDGGPRPANQNFDIGADEIGNCYVRINGVGQLYGSVQRAADESTTGDVLHVAGICKGVGERDLGSETVKQSLYLNKSIGVQGGYTLTQWLEPDPVANSTTLDAGGQGRVVYLDSSNVITLAGLHLRGGYALQQGGAVYNAGATVTLDGNWLHDNAAAAGGAYYHADGSSLLLNNFFYSNQAEQGGAIYNASGTLALTIQHNTIYSNTAQQGGGFYTEDQIPTIRSTIFATNTATTAHAIFSEGSFSGGDYNDVYPIANAYNSWAEQGLHTLSLAPRFEDAEAGDLRLADASPLFDRGDPASPVTQDFEYDLRPADQGFDIGADERRACWARVVRNDEEQGVYANPQLAIDNSLPGDEIQVTVGICRGVHEYAGELKQTVHITQNLTLGGGYARDFEERFEPAVDYPPFDEERTTTFDAGELGRALLVTNTEAVSITLINLAHGLASAGGGLDAGGGLYYASGRGKFSRLVLHHNTAADGGALYQAGATLAIADSLLAYNSAENGGAIYLPTGALTVTDSTRFYHNDATGDGGAIYNRDGSLWMVNNTAALLTYNAAGAGGYIYNHSGDVYLENNRIVRNFATDGAALYNASAGTMILRNNRIYSNTADNGGGALYSAGTTSLDLANRLYGNQASSGGAIYVSGDELLVQNTLIYLNVGTNKGGGVYVVAGDPFIMHNDFYKNSAGVGGGGAVYIAAGTPVVKNNIFDSNVADVGSAVYGATGALSHNDYWVDGPADQVQGGVGVGDDNLNSSPLYEEFDPSDDPGVWNFHLARGSILVDAGVVVTGQPVSRDMDNEHRPSNAAPDMGADEVVDCLAQVVSTGQLYGQIGLALAAAGSGDTIKVAEGTCNETLAIDKDITISGGWAKTFSGMAEEASNLVSPYSEEKRVITIGENISVTLENLNLIAGSKPGGNGGGVYVSANSVVKLDLLDIYGCSASGNGGGIYNAAGSNVTIWDTIVYQCEAGGNGGGIYNASGSTVQISGGGTALCEAGGDGGGIYSDGGADVTLTNHSISFNVAEYGGGLYSAMGNTDILNVKFWVNIARQDGGGLYNTGDNVNLYHLTFYENNAPGSTGGGLYNEGSNMVINASIIAANDAATGDGLYSTSNVAVGHTLRWGDTYVNAAVTDELHVDPQLTYGGALTYNSPAIDAVPESASTITFDCYVSPRPQLCDKDMGAQEYRVGKRNLEWNEVADHTLAPGEIYTYTFAVTNLSEQWFWDDSENPGTGYTETIVLDLATSRDWAEIAAVVGEVRVTDITTDSATIDVGPGKTAQILVRVTIPPGQPASVEGDSTTLETTRLVYRAQMCGFTDLTGEFEVLSKVIEDYQAELGPGRVGVVQPGGTITYTHTLTNTGNVTDTYSFYPSSGFYAQGTIVAPPGNVTLAPLMTETVVLSVVANLEAAHGLVDLTEAMALSAGGGAAASAVNRTTISPTHGTRYLALDGTDSLVDETVGGGVFDYADNNCSQPNLGACRTLQHVLSQASAGDTIKIAAGHYTATYTTTHASQVITQALFINQPLTVTGGYLSSAWDESPPDHITHATTLDAGGAGRLFYITVGSGAVRLERLTLTQGDATGFVTDAGGALYNEGADLTLNALNIHTNDADLGGGLYSAAGEILLTNSLLHANGGSATQGGGLYAQAGTLTVLNDTFHANQASDTGGALYMAGGTLAMTNTIIAGHSSGSAVYAGAASSSDYNLYWDNTPDDVGGTATLGGHAVQADPQLDADLSLLYTSPARDVADPGTDLGLIPLDYANNPRLLGGWVDLGAREFYGDPGVSLVPDNEQALLVGASHIYTHTLTNTGDLTDTFDISVTGSSWVTGFSPAVVNGLPPAQSATIEVYVTVPVGAGGAEEVAYVRATSRGAGHPADSATDTTFALFTPGVIISSGQSGGTLPATPITYTHTVTNTGTGQDTYIVTHESPAGWTVDHIPALTLGFEETGTLTVQVIPPADALSSTVGTVTVTVTSAFSPTVQDLAADNTVVAQTHNLQLTPDYFRAITNQTAVTYTHTLTNAGNYTETIMLAKDHTQEWVGQLLPDTSAKMGPFTAIPLLFRLIDIPADSGGKTDIATITATVPGAPAVHVVDTTHIIPRYEFALTPLAQSLTVAADKVVTFTHVLTNLGNLEDAFTLVAVNNLGGWPDPVLSDASVTLSPGASRSVVITATVPGGSLGQVNETTLRVTSSEGAFKEAVDTITVETPVIRTVEIGLPDSCHANPGETVTYQHTVTNTGNVSDTYTLDAASELGWTGLSVEPGQVELEPDETHPVTVTFTVPASASAGLVEHTTVTATSQTDNGVSATLVDTTTVNLVGGLIFVPDRAGNALPGDFVVYTHTLTNTGSAEDTFDLIESSSQGWPVELSASQVTLAAWETAQVVVTVTVPSTAAVGLVDTTTVTATSQFDGAWAKVEDETTALLEPGVELAPPRSSNADPGESVLYTHVVTNTGNGTDTFDLTAVSDQGWVVNVLPTPLTLAADETRTVTVTLQVPGDALSGTVDVSTVTATSQADGSISDSVTDTTTVNRVAGLTFVPDRAGNALPGDFVVYTHTLTNTGSAEDTFDLIESSSRGWPVELSASQVPLAAWETAQIVVTVTVPSTAAVGLVDTTTVTATSQFNPACFDRVIDTTAAVPNRDLIFSPDYQRSVDPGAVEYYRHVLTNTGDVTDTFVITWTAAAGWTGVEPERIVALPAGASAPVTVTVAVPAGTLSGTVATALITATSENDLAVWDTVMDVTTVNLVRGFSLSAGMMQNAVAGELVTYLHQVTNNGNYTDTFLAEVVSTQGWTATVAPEMLSLAAGLTDAITLSLLVPDTAATNTVEGTVLTLTTQSLPVLLETVTDTTTIVEAPAWSIYLPLVMRNYTSNAPDLVVTTLEATPDGGNYLISVTVKNQGPQPVAYGNNFFVDFYVDRIPAFKLVGDVSWGVQGDWFGVGESRVLSATYTLAAGTHQLYAQVDTDNTVVEANESNNVTGPQTIVVTSSAQSGDEEPLVTPAPTPLPGPRPTPTAMP